MKLLLGIGLTFILAASVGLDACSTGTNTGNGGPACPFIVCGEPVSVTASDGSTYRGRVQPDTTIASSGNAQSAPNPPVVALVFVGGQVEYTDTACNAVDTGASASDSASQVRIYISAAESSVDTAGTLHVHGARRDGYYASGPSRYGNDESTMGWAVDLTLTADGNLMATLSTTGYSFLGAGGAMGDPRMMTQTITMSGPIAPTCVPGADGVLTQATFTVSGGSVFKLPCRKVTSCDFSNG